MKTRTIITVAVAILAIGIAGCNMGPDSDTEMKMGAEFADVESEVSWVDPPECYGLRHYYRWSCVDGAWAKVYVGRQDTDCNGMVFPDLETTNCYTEFATYRCDSESGHPEACGELQHVCPPAPTYRCRPVFHPPTEFARIR